MSLTRRSALSGLAAAGLAPRASAQAPELGHAGPPVQGGAIIFRSPWPRAAITVGDEAVGSASASGLFVVGFDRDAPATETVTATAPGAGISASKIVSIRKGDFDIQRVDGLRQDTVTPEAPETLAKIAAEAERKAVGFASDVDADWFRDGFDMPLRATRVSGRFGGQRILNGVPARPHYGTDLAAPKGTPIHAPCDGLVSFAETGLHYEGGLVMIDHGQGLVSAYLHMARVEVRNGQTVGRGEKIGEVGAEGRATGPHLCWRLKWRGRNLDPTLLVGVRAP